MTGIARGSSTSSSCCRGVMPTPRAASLRAGSTPAIPVTVFRSTGRIPYSVNPTMAGRNPMLCRSRAASTGTIAASRARLGTVWMIPARANDGCSSQAMRVAAMPSGTLIPALNSSASRVSCRCAVR